MDSQAVRTPSGNISDNPNNRSANDSSGSCEQTNSLNKTILICHVLKNSHRQNFLVRLQQRLNFSQRPYFWLPILRQHLPTQLNKQNN